jgi:hypothetical protein
VATGVQAAERIAAATGLLPSSVFRTARTLREAGKGLWPEAAKGGGKGAAHVERRHLINLAIALAVNDPLAAVKAIPAYRGLIPHRPEKHAPDPEHAGQAASLLMTNDMFNGRRAIGAELDRLLDLLTQGDTAGTLENAGLHIEFFIELRVPRVCVRYHAFDLEDDLATHTTELLYRKPNTPPGVSRELDPYWNFLPPRLITRTALIPVSLFTVMADLWADTKRHHAETTARQTRRPTVLIEE